MQNRLEDLNKKIMAWGDARKITTNGNVAMQLLKLNEEFLKEFYESDGDEEKIKDSIGDSMVVLTMIDGIVNKGVGVLRDVNYDDDILRYYGDNSTWCSDLICHNIGAMSSIAVRNKVEEQKKEFNIRLIHCYELLMLLALSLDLCPIDCLDHAYNEIKDRTGELLPNGVFVKESDLKA